jgi:hypothetical protein
VTYVVNLRLAVPDDLKGEAAVAKAAAAMARTQNLRSTQEEDRPMGPIDERITK